MGGGAGTLHKRFQFYRENSSSSFENKTVPQWGIL